MRAAPSLQFETGLGAVCRICTSVRVILLAAGIGFLSIPQAHADTPDSVCLEHPMQALSAYLSSYEDASALLARTRSVDFYPFSFMGRDQASGFRNAMVDALDFMPGHLVLIYHIDPTMICVFAWEATAPEEMIYIRHTIDRDALEDDASAIAALFAARVPRGAARSADRGGRALLRMPSGATPEDRLSRIAKAMAPDTVLHAAIARAEALVFHVPGPLAALPYLALPLGGSAPLIETHAVTLLSGLNDMIDPRTSRAAAPLEWQSSSGSSVVVVADPHTPAEGIGGAKFSALPGAAREATEIALRKGGRLIEGADATGTEILAALQDADVFHYAGHAVADPDRPLEGSFLALADGALDARTIQMRSLSKGPLVVLSACDTGQGQTLGAGIVGLARGFQIAGAAGTVLSHWPVSDLSAEPLMLTFHDELVQVTPAEALRRAALQLRSDYPDPADWAAFSYFGIPFVLPASEDGILP